MDDCGSVDLLFCWVFVDARYVVSGLGVLVRCGAMWCDVVQSRVVVCGDCAS